MSEQPMLAAIPAPDLLPVDPILEDMALRAKQASLKVAGFLQRRDCAAPGCDGQLQIERIGTGDRQRILQPLGSGAGGGCRLNPAAIADVSGSLLAEIEAATGTRADLLILNRFGRSESEGRGFRTAIEAAYARGIPVLTAVRETYAEAWRDFAGDFGVLLPPDAANVAAWLENVIAFPPVRRAV